MRTTVTLDPDVERMVKEKARKTRQSFKQVLNNAIRQALREEAVPAGKAFDVKSRPMRLRTGIDPARLSEIGDDLEVDAFLQTTNRLTSKLSS
jgi:hypothetical protein